MDERERQVREYMSHSSAPEQTARIMCALYAPGFVEPGSAEDDPETAADLYAKLLDYGLDIVRVTGEEQ